MAIKNGYPLSAKEKTKLSDKLVEDMKSAAKVSKDFYESLPSVSGKPESTATSAQQHVLRGPDSSAPTTSMAISHQQLPSPQMMVMKPAVAVAKVSGKPELTASSSKQDVSQRTAPTSLQLNFSTGNKMAAAQNSPNNEGTAVGRSTGCSITTPKAVPISFLEPIRTPDQLLLSDTESVNLMSRRVKIVCTERPRQLDCNPSEESSSNSQQPSTTASALVKNIVSSLEPIPISPLQPIDQPMALSRIETLISNTHGPNIDNDSNVPPTTNRKRSNSTPPAAEEPAAKKTKSLAERKAILFFQKLWLRLKSLEREVKTLPDIIVLTRQVIDCLELLRHDKLKIAPLALRNHKLYPRLCTLHFHEEQSVLKHYLYALTGFQALNTRVKDALNEDKSCSRIDLELALDKKKHPYIYEVFDSYTQETVKHACELSLHYIHILEQLPSPDFEYEESLKRKLQDLRTWRPPTEAMLETIHCFLQFIDNITKKIINYSLFDETTPRMIATELFKTMNHDFKALDLFCEGCNGGTA